MAGGFGGQTLALDVNNDGFNLANPLDAANRILQARAQTAQTNAATEEDQARTATLNAGLPGVQAESQDRVNQSKLTTVKTQSQLIADRAAKINPADTDAAEQWDEAMGDLAGQGVTGAQQFVGKYTPRLQQSVVSSYGAPNPLEAAAASGASGAPPPGVPPQLAAQLDQRFQGMPPAQMQAIATRFDATKEALMRVQNSANPSAQWNTEVAGLGFPNAVGKYNPLRVQQMLSEVDPMDAYIQGRLLQANAGAPGPVPNTKVQEAAGGLYGVTEGPNGPTVKALTPVGKWQLVGTDPATQKGVYKNDVTGEEKIGADALGMKPGTNNLGKSVFEKKQTAWLDTHPGDKEGALDFANGKKTMTAQAAQIAAESQASRDLQALSLGGSPPPDPAAYMREQTAIHYNDIMGGAGPGGGAAPAPAAVSPSQLPARAIAQLHEGKNTTFNNGTVWTLKGGKPVQVK